MQKEQSRNTKENLQYRIIEIKKISYFENDFRTFNLTEAEVQSGNVRLGSLIEIEPDKGMLSFILEAKFSVPKDDSEYETFGIRSSYKFQIREFKKNVHPNKDGKYYIPSDFLIPLLTMCISGTRGMLAVLNTNPAYANIYLPVVDAQQFLKYTEMPQITYSSEKLDTEDNNK